MGNELARGIDLDEFKLRINCRVAPNYGSKGNRAACTGRVQHEIEAFGVLAHKGHRFDVPGGLTTIVGWAGNDCGISVRWIVGLGNHTTADACPHHCQHHKHATAPQPGAYRDAPQRVALCCHASWSAARLSNKPFGNSLGGSAETSLRVLTPVSTSAVCSPERCAPRMSVSSLSPTINV